MSKDDKWGNLRKAALVAKEFDVTSPNRFIGMRAELVLELIEGWEESRGKKEEPKTVVEEILERLRYFDKNMLNTDSNEKEAQLEILIMALIQAVEWLRALSSHSDEWLGKGSEGYLFSILEIMKGNKTIEIPKE